jgi:prephenate dehydrogenase
MTTTPIVNTLVVIGLGLIGGSFAAGMKAAGACKQVVAVVRRREDADFALKKGIIDRFCLSIDEIANELSAGDVIFIAVPALSVKKVLLDIKEENVPESVTITDATSVKGIIVSAAAEVYGSVPDQFVLGHPIAGSEKNGITAANGVLYRGHRVILTPLPTTNSAHRVRVEKMWQAIGAEVLIMSVTEHDKVLAATSHLPHVIAYALVDTLCRDTHKETTFRYAAGGFRDFTRIASSDPTMWHDIVLTNREAILQSIELFQHNLNSVRHAIETQDSDYLLKVFTRAKEARDLFSKENDKKVM